MIGIAVRIQSPRRKALFKAGMKMAYHSRNNPDLPRSSQAWSAYCLRKIWTWPFASRPRCGPGSSDQLGYGLRPTRRPWYFSTLINWIHLQYSCLPVNSFSVADLDGKNCLRLRTMRTSAWIHGEKRIYNRVGNLWWWLGYEPLWAVHSGMLVIYSILFNPAPQWWILYTWDQLI